MTQDALIPNPAPKPKPQFTYNPYSWALPAGWRSATPRPCPRCKTPTITGLNDDQAAFQATTDVTPLTPLGEALHQLTGNPTYTLTRCGQRGIKLTRRDAWNITQQPAGSPRIDVLPAHQCKPPPLPPEAYTARQIAPPKPDTDRNAPPPF